MPLPPIGNVKYCPFCSTIVEQPSLGAGKIDMIPSQTKHRIIELPEDKVLIASKSATNEETQTKTNDRTEEHSALAVCDMRLEKAQAGTEACEEIVKEDGQHELNSIDTSPVKALVKMNVDAKARLIKDEQPRMEKRKNWPVWQLITGSLILFIVVKSAMVNGNKAELSEAISVDKPKPVPVVTYVNQQVATKSHLHPFPSKKSVVVQNVPQDSEIPAMQSAAHSNGQEIILPIHDKLKSNK
jgi:hypothetical protein